MDRDIAFDGVFGLWYGKVIGLIAPAKP